MAMKSERWQTITPSQFPWEQHGLDYLRTALPDHEPYRAWSNFEFQAANGALYEVDLLVLTKSGLFLVELKHRRGTVRGDAGTWTWTNADGREWSEDNPYPLANRKAKALASVLSAQPALKHTRLPFLEALVFVYSMTDDLVCDLRGPGRSHVCLKDELEPNKAGIAVAVKGGFFQGSSRSTALVDAKLARQLSQAMDEAGIRRAQKYRRVGDYELEKLLFEGPDFQDRLAKHVSVPNLERRVRLYLLDQAAADEQRQRLKRAALREFQLLQGIAHPGIVAVHDYKEHELGPALLFDYDRDALRLDHFLIAHRERLTAQQRLHLVRQLAEAMRYMHGRRIVHRGLSPESILVAQPETALPRLKIFNWQTGLRDGATSGTTHVQDLLERQSMVYLAPEAINTPGEAGEHCDIFSLGAVAFHIFAGQPPAADHLELYEKLARDRGLRLSAVVDGSPASLEELIQRSTHPDVFSRIDSVGDFLELLDQVEQEVAGPEARAHVDPLDANARPGDELGHGYTFLRRLGEGATAVAILADKDDQQVVLKVARSAEEHGRLEAEAEALRAVRHPYVVQLLERVQLSGRTALVLSKAGEKTLAARLREDGPLAVDLLQRFGEDLLSTMQTLEEHGIAHRDIKPENLGVTAVGRGDALHLVLYDFSLSRAPAEQIFVGTKAYRDPFLPLRRPPRWDWSAERYSAAATLYEMATGTLPVWGDGKSDPALVPCELRIDAGAFEPPELRQPLTAFFERALHREPRQRFDNAEEMRRAWARLFDAVDETRRESGVEAEPSRAQVLEAALAVATLESWIAELGLSTRARNALERAGVLTVKALLAMPPRELQFMRGVGKKTRDELLAVSLRLRERFPQVEVEAPKRPEKDALEGAEVSTLSVDHLGELIVGPRPTGGGKKRWENRRRYLGLEEEGSPPREGGTPPLAPPRRRGGEEDTETAGDAAQLPPPLAGEGRGGGCSEGPGGGSSAALRLWPTQGDVAKMLGVTRANVGAQVVRDREEWRRQPAVVALQAQLVELVDGFGGVMTAEELCTAVLAARGSVQEDPGRRMRLAAAVTRAALEVELGQEEPRLLLRRPEGRVLVVRRAGLEDYALALGREADRLVAQAPLPSAVRVLDALQAIQPPDGVAMRPDRLVRLAAALSRTAAVSGRLELYPRGMPAEQAIRLAAGTLVGVEELSLDQLRERILGRFPEAEALPERPMLDGLLEQAGLSLVWDPGALEGRGAYRRPMRQGQTFSTRVESRSSTSSQGGALPGGPTEPGQSDAQVFEAQLRRSIEGGGFLVLTVKQRHLYRAEDALVKRFGLERVSLDEALIGALKEAARRYEVDWQVVLEADAAPAGSYDQENLAGLVGEVVPRLEARISGASRPVLLVDPGLLARFDRMEMLERVRDAAGRPGRVPLCWVLVPTDEQQAQPMIDRKVIPLLTTAQRARVPAGWLDGGT